MENSADKKDLNPFDILTKVGNLLKKFEPKNRSDELGSYESNYY